LELKEKPPRLACYTPDGDHLIVVLHPSKYSAYQSIKIPSGETIDHPERLVQNVELYDITRAGGYRRGAFCPKDHGHSDDIQAMAVAPDGKSIFLANTTHLLQINFERAFRVALRPPLPR